MPEPVKQAGSSNAGATVPLTRQLHNMEGLVHRVLGDKQPSAARYLLSSQLKGKPCMHAHYQLQ